MKIAPFFALIGFSGEKTGIKEYKCMKYIHKTFQATTHEKIS